MDGGFEAGQLVSAHDALAWFDVPVFVLDVIGDTDRRYVMRGVNPAYEAVAGAMASDTIGRSIADLFPPRIATTLQRYYDRCVQAGSVLSYEETLCVDGVERWFFTTLTPRTDAKGRVTQIFGLTRDITQQKTTALSQAHDLAKLSALNSELRTLTAMAAHDLRGPLGTMESLLDLLLEDFQDMGDGKHELLTASLNVIGALRPQIEAVLTRALALDPKVNRFQTVDLGHICTDLAALVDPLGAKSITFPTQSLQADPIALQLVLRNLLDNAARYARSKISISLDLDNPKMPVITVADDGPGLENGRAEDLGLANCSADLERMQSGFGLNAVRHMIQSRGGTFALIPKGALGGLSAQFSRPAPSLP